MNDVLRPTQIEISRLVTDPTNHRPPLCATVQEDSDLVASIRACGIEQPLVVVPWGRGAYMIRSGHRRYQAAVALAMTTVPCVLGDFEDDQRKHVGRQIAANTLVAKTGAWQIMRSLGKMVGGARADNKTSLLEAIRWAAQATGMTEKKIEHYVLAYNNLHVRAHIFLENNQREASTISLRKLIEIGRSSHAKQVQLLAREMGFEDDATNDDHKEKKQQKPRKKQPMGKSVTLRGINTLSTACTVRLTSGKGKLTATVVLRDADGPVLHTDGEWTTSVGNLLKEAVCQAVEAVCESQQGATDQRSESRTSRSSTVIAIVPTRVFKDLQVTDSVSPIAPLP